MTPPTTANVKKPAETFSFVVAGVVSIMEFPVDGLVIPALESPTLVPPVLFVTGATALTPGTSTIEL
jgi:hypothetical protein